MSEDGSRCPVCGRETPFGLTCSLCVSVIVPGRYVADPSLVAHVQGMAEAAGLKVKITDVWPTGEVYMEGCEPQVFETVTLNRPAR